MNVTYPHMGTLSIPVCSMLQNLGIEVTEAPPITKKTVELGSLHSPEGACLPYKINMGNFLESIDKGADTMVTVCGAGKCRLGFYNAVQKIDLSNKLNTPPQFYTLNTSGNLFFNLYHTLRSMAPDSARFPVIKNIILAIKKLKALDAISEAKNYFGPRSSLPDNIINTYNTGTAQLGLCKTFAEIDHMRNRIIDTMRIMAGESAKQPIKVGLLGDFYVLLEPYVNHKLEDLLIKQGVEVKKFIYTGDWAYSQSLLRTFGLYNEEKAYLRQARPYLNYHVGGDGLKTVGTALWCAQHGFDGIIHIYPFGCMPEVVAQYALKNVAKDYSFPMLALSIDEHSSDVGIVTRIEAFVDCLKRKKGGSFE